ncbi:hypothetical protein PFISCL1PPCAC_25946, partial [Pristionchus fissidentatus]
FIVGFSSVVYYLILNIISGKYVSTPSQTADQKIMEIKILRTVTTCPLIFFHLFLLVNHQFFAMLMLSLDILVYFWNKFTPSNDNNRNLWTVLLFLSSIYCSLTFCAVIPWNAL